MNITYTILPIQYNYIFNDSANELTEYLKMIPRKAAISFSLFISNYTGNVGWKEQLSCLPINAPIKGECYLKMSPHEAEFPKATYVLFTPNTGIELLKNIFAIPIDEYHPIVEWQRILIKAITLVNSTLINEGPNYQDTSFNLFCKSVKKFRYELDDRILLYGAVYRAMCLADFLENEHHGIWQNLLVDLKKKLNIDSIRNYMRAQIKLFNKLEVHPKTKFQIFRAGKNSKEIQNVATPYSSIIRQESNKDYTEFKKKPFVQICEGEFAVIKNSFVGTLIYDRLKFGLLECYKKSYKAKVKGFFGLFNQDFIEKNLFDKVLLYSFISPHLKRYICFTEHDCINRIDQFIKLNPGIISKDNAKNLMDGYIRHNNQILLIECKGKIISEKALFDKNILFEDITTGLVGKEGTGQLESYCKRIIDRDCVWDLDIPKYCIIYPLLLVDDIGFSANGFNQYVIESTEKFVKDNKSVFPFTVLDMDTFILISELIRRNKLNIFKEIESYHKHIYGHNFDEKTISFATFLRFKYETRWPKVVSTWLKKIFK